MHCQGAAVLQGKRAFVVEDEMLIALLLEEQLGDFGCVVAATVSTVDEALRLADTVEADIAVLDVNVGGKEVYPVAEKLAARNIPFIFTTGYGVGGLAEKWRARPAAPKPFEAADLRAALEAALAE